MELFTRQTRYCIAGNYFPSARVWRGIPACGLKCLLRTAILPLYNVLAQKLYKYSNFLIVYSAFYLSKSINVASQEIYFRPLVCNSVHDVELEYILPQSQTAAFLLHINASSMLNSLSLTAFSYSLIIHTSLRVPPNYPDPRGISLQSRDPKPSHFLQGIHTYIQRNMIFLYPRQIA